MPPPEFYDDWDPDAHDRETERLEDLTYRHRQDDLRNLRSEVEEEQAEARRRAKPARFDYRAIREAFEADNPKPDDRDYDARAEWEWRLQEHIFVATDNDTYLHRHRMERGAYVARHAAMMRRSQERVDDLFRPLRERPRPSGAWEPIPWPVGDGVSAWRRRFEEVRGPGEEPDGAFDEPSYDACLDLRAGMLGWFQSLEEEEREPSKLFRKAAEEAMREIRGAYEAEYRPATIGRAQLRIRRGILRCDDALDLLDGLRGYDGLTPEAYDRLRELVEAVRETATERYAELRGLYDAYRERAIRILGPEGVAGL